MPAARQSADAAPASPVLDAFDEVSEAVEAGAGLPAVARAAAQALEASVVVLDARSSILAVACQSPEDERAVLAGEGATEVAALRVADAEVGQLRLRPRGRAARAGAAAHGHHADRPGGRPRPGARAGQRGRGGRLPGRPAHAPR